jgi:hypothetical protein
MTYTKWTIFFLAIVACAMIPLMLGNKLESIFLGYPLWLWYYVLLHLAFVYGLYKFSSNFKETER